MTCNGCVAKVKQELQKMENMQVAEIQLAHPQAVLTMQHHIPLTALQKSLSKLGKYTITEEESKIPAMHSSETDGSWLATYKPILLIFAYILGITILVEVNRGAWNVMLWMENFMASFFLIFSFFKLLDVKGFADSYSSYDIIANKWKGWGYAYPFIELALGVAYLLRFFPLITNIATFLVMSISITGVLQSVFQKRKIKCACLGAVFNLPMSTVTIIEDAFMIAMSAWMILMLSLNIQA